MLEPIRFQSIRRNEVGHKAPAGKIKQALNRGDLGGLQLLVDEDRQQRASTVLVAPAYVIEAHFQMTQRAGADDSEGKHLDIFNRRAAREQIAFISPASAPANSPRISPCWRPMRPCPCAARKRQGTDLGFGAPRDLGLMLWDIDHAAPGRPSLFFRASLRDGVMDVPAPGSAG